MKKKNIPFYTLVFLLLLVNIYYFALPMLNKSDRNLEKETSDITLNSDELLNSFKINEKKSNEFYAGKILEVVGLVKEISFMNNRNTLILYTKNKDASVICDVHPSQIEKIKTLKKKSRNTCKRNL